ncbi:MAG: hypothetical protein E6J61_18070 [Deltaproteobacteria bacterium]|nr:MAG: hypothetical protein E6J61_18070 [Deltaproteobacteria bacterium]
MSARKLASVRARASRVLRTSAARLRHSIAMAASAMPATPTSKRNQKVCHHAGRMRNVVAASGLQGPVPIRARISNV